MYTYENQPIDELIDEICTHYPDLEEHLRRIEDVYEKQVEDMLADFEESQKDSVEQIDALEDDVRDLKQALDNCYDEQDSLVDDIDSLKQELEND